MHPSRTDPTKLARERQLFGQCEGEAVFCARTRLLLIEQGRDIPVIFHFALDYLVMVSNTLTEASTVEMESSRLHAL